jgi:hypothetical protein
MEFSQKITYLDESLEKVGVKPSSSWEGEVPKSDRPP